MESKQKKNDLTLQTKILISKDNSSYISEFTDYCRSLKPDKIRYSMVKDYGQATDCSVDESGKKEVFHFLERASVMSREAAHQLVWGKKFQTEVPSKCWICELGMYGTLEPNGNVFACSQWSQDDTVCLGNVYDTDYNTIWKSDRHDEIVTELNKRCSKRLCNPNTCRHYYSNSIIDYLVRTNNFATINKPEHLSAFI